MHLDPLNQFKIKELFKLHIGKHIISVSNSGATIIITSFASVIFLLIATHRMKKRKISSVQSFIEILFKLSVSTFESSLGHKINKLSRPYSKYILSVFLMILFLNLQSMIPGSFATTSQFSVTLAAGMTVMVATLILMIRKNGIKFLGSLIPDGTPWWISPMIFLLELISFMIRPISLCVRLGANIIAGHIMLEVLSALAFSGGLLFGPFAFILILAINLLEFGVVCLQAYIFASLSAVYLSQAMHH